mmetsp:Transcript_2414/g.7144  ORF Transcript_2414/g.7144 Transcript_2414/m.7144 type:complete len:372 (+) Transcript_2414:80-1195(+)
MTLRVPPASTLHGRSAGTRCRLHGGSRLRGGLRGALLIAASLALPSRGDEGDLASVCYHENEANVGASSEIAEGQSVYREIFANQTHRYFYSNVNVQTMNRPDEYRKLLINLEPCRGVVYLFVRKTRRCYPNPYSCIDLRPGYERRDPASCAWTHFMSEIDGSRDGTATFFEVPLSSTKWYISVFATEKSAYTLTVLADTGAFPRPGGHGKITARQLRELQVEIAWDTAAYVPEETTTTDKYWVYSSMLLETDRRTNTAVFMRPDKIMNTVCGLQNNTDRQYTTVAAAECSNGRCSATIDPVITDKRYVFNVVAESNRGYKIAYAGLIMRTDWETVRQATSDKTLQVIGAVSGSVLGMVVIIFFVLLKLYG